jgi:class 3 adenylate cyclase
VRTSAKIEPDPKAPRFIVTVLGEGYKFAAKLRENRLTALPETGGPGAEDAPEGSPLSPPERRQLRVISCGLVGSAALASRLDPEDLRAVIADYERCCTEVIGGFGGVVATALFRLPGAHEYDVERAVRAGLALIDSVGSLNIPLAPALHVRVGIASGLVVAGSAALDKSNGHEPVDRRGAAPRGASSRPLRSPTRL